MSKQIRSIRITGSTRIRVQAITRNSNMPSEFDICGPATYIERATSIRHEEYEGLVRSGGEGGASSAGRVWESEDGFYVQAY